MLRSLAIAAFVLSGSTFARAAQGACEEFARGVKATYNFKPSLLKDEADSDARSASMDRFWEKVKADQKTLLPCLRAALKDPQSDPWFRFDGVNLLVSLDPSPESKAEMVRQYTAVDLGDVNLQFWVGPLARLGAEGFDVSAAGERWLRLEKPEYYLPQHGAYRVDRLLGAIFIYGSMDEAQATPALLKIAGTPGHPGREVALSLLLMQATPEAQRGLREVNQSGRTPEAQAALRTKLENPPLITPREKPRTSREQFLKAFGDAAKGDWETFINLTQQVPDGERDAAAVLRPEDLPLVRRVRRLLISRANPHAANYYVDFTKILDTVIRARGAAK